MPADNLWPTEEEERALDRAHAGTARDVERGTCRRATHAELVAASRAARRFRLMQQANDRRAGRGPVKGGG